MSKNGYDTYGRKTMRFDTAEIIVYEAGTQDRNNKVEALLLIVRDLTLRIKLLEKKNNQKDS